MTNDDLFWQTYEEYCKMKQQDEVIKYQIENELPTDAGSETGIELEPGYEN